MYHRCTDNDNLHTRTHYQGEENYDNSIAIRIEAFCLSAHN
jgi:hypothetical protein